MAKTLKQRRTAPHTDEYEIRGARGSDAGAKHTAVSGKPVPPTPKSGQGYALHRPAHHTGALVTRSGRTVLISPAKSPNTLNAWSKAFKK
jgi:hypothetical protein